MAYLQVGSDNTRVQAALLSCLSAVRGAYLQCHAHDSHLEGFTGKNGFPSAVATFVHGQLSIIDWSIEECKGLAPS